MGNIVALTPRMRETSPNKISNTNLDELSAKVSTIDIGKINQEWLIPGLQQTLDTKMQNKVVKHNALTAEITEVINGLQRVSLELMRNENPVHLETTKTNYLELLDRAKQLLPSHPGNITPVVWDASNLKDVKEKIQYQIEHLQLLCNTEQTKATNLLDLSLKNYFAISNTLSEIAKTLFGFIKHVLGNSTGR